ncbi:MAG TPA: L,D-transpeptidase family protein [Sphingomicrobium sp.]|nr:L,D-transpeptidase family protein [Sphingomicrobium sp.]
MNKLKIVALGASGLAFAFQPALAGAATAVDGQSAAIPVATAVAAFYDTWHAQPIWFRNGPDTAAIAQLTAILQRAPFDGFPEGPQLAEEVQAAAARANSGKPGDITEAERTLSSAWVAYVEAIKRPTTGMIYAYPVLKPQGSRADEILLTAAAAPSLSAYLASTSDVNSIYKQLRDAGWAEAQASGNMTPDPRLLANLDRVRSLPARGRFLLVDSGSSMLTLYQDGQPIDSMKVITGMRELPTPLIASYMYYITYNPYWHAPDHLVRKTIAPNFLHGGMTYLKSHGYHVIDDWSEHPTVIDPTTVDWKGAAAGKVHLKIQQDPGPVNSMGILKFPFANPQDIYLHDTPDHAKFELANRNLSNGCVRVEDAKRLGRWLLGHDPVSPGSEPELRVQLPGPTPIYLTYITAQVKDGKISYLPDLYGWDRTPPEFASN